MTDRPQMTSPLDAKVKELVERFDRQVKVALQYAQDEKPKHEEYIASVFELQVGHLRDIGKDFTALITTQAERIAELSDRVHYAEGTAQANIDRANEAEAENAKLREALKPFAEKAGLIIDELGDDYCPDWSPFIPQGAYKGAALAAKGGE